MLDFKFLKVFNGIPYVLSEFEICSILIFTMGGGTTAVNSVNVHLGISSCARGCFFLVLLFIVFLFLELLRN